MAEYENFFSELQKCTAGERASFRRNCGKLLKEADGQAMMAFYRCLPRQTPQWQEERWFAAACFSCLWDADQRGEPIENIFSELKDDSDSIEHCLASLLDLSWESDGYLLGKMCRIIKMIKSKGMIVDCSLLLDDLIYWNSSKQSVQRKWARAMYIRNSIIDKEN